MTHDTYFELQQAHQRYTETRLIREQLSTALNKEGAQDPNHELIDQALSTDETDDQEAAYSLAT